MAHVRVPHIDIPPRFAGGKIVVVEQDSDAEVRNCVEIALRFRRGFRPEALDCGIPEQAFSEGGADIDQIIEHVGEQEPRAGLLLERIASELEQAKTLEQGIDVVRAAVDSTVGPGARVVGEGR
jgi:hypothetical protein